MKKSYARGITSTLVALLGLSMAPEAKAQCLPYGLWHRPYFGWPTYIHRPLIYRGQVPIQSSGDPEGNATANSIPFDEETRKKLQAMASPEPECDPKILQMMEDARQEADRYRTRIAELEAQLDRALNERQYYTRYATPDGIVDPIQYDDVLLEAFSHILRNVSRLTEGVVDLTPFHSKDDPKANILTVRNSEQESVYTTDLNRIPRRITTKQLLKREVGKLGNYLVGNDIVTQDVFTQSLHDIVVESGTYSVGTKPKTKVPESRLGPAIEN